MQGHWTGAVADPAGSFGFIYLIEDRTSGRKYIGRKNYWVSRSGVPGCRSKVMNKKDSKWKEKCWRGSDWKTYKGSSVMLKDWIKNNPDNEYVFTILYNADSKGTLHYSECKEQWLRDVLTKKLEDGTYEYFNQSIASIKFRPRL